KPVSQYAGAYVHMVRLGGAKAQRHADDQEDLRVLHGAREAPARHRPQRDIDHRNEHEQGDHHARKDLEEPLDLRERRTHCPSLRSCAGQIWMMVVFTSRNSSMWWIPDSRPYPLSLKPPNGMAGSIAW